MEGCRLESQGKLNADLTTEIGLKVRGNEGERGESLAIWDEIYYVLKSTWEKMFDNLYKQQRTLWIRWQTHFPHGIKNLLWKMRNETRECKNKKKM